MMMRAGRERWKRLLAATERGWLALSTEVVGSSAVEWLKKDEITVEEVGNPKLRFQLSL